MFYTFFYCYLGGGIYPLALITLIVLVNFKRSCPFRLNHNYTQRYKLLRIKLNNHGNSLILITSTVQLFYVKSMLLIPTSDGGFVNSKIIVITSLQD